MSQSRATGATESNRFPFSKRRIEELQPPDSERVYYRDTKTPGLNICVTRAGSKTFYHVKKIAGRTRRKRIGGFPEVTVEQARKEADRLEREGCRWPGPARREDGGAWGNVA